MDASVIVSPSMFRGYDVERRWGLDIYGAVLTVTASGDLTTNTIHTYTKSPSPSPSLVSSFQAVLPITNKPTIYSTRQSIQLSPTRRLHTTARYIVRGSRTRIEVKDQRIPEDKRYTPHHTTRLYWIVGYLSFRRTLHRHRHELLFG